MVFELTMDLVCDRPNYGMDAKGQIDVFSISIFV